MEATNLTNSFADYLTGGWEINVVVGLDFTASNGNPNDPSSLHFRHPHVPNQYQSAISSVIGNVLSLYDRDQVYPVLGFGAKFPNGQTLFTFHCNLNAETPNVNGVDGILDAYNRSLAYVTLHGPTNFAPLIRHTCHQARGTLNSKVYYVLLIITDGEISDMQDTIKVIVREVVPLPISIIIVGVGDSEFESMNVLDGDGPEGLTTERGERAKRDVVQFRALSKVRPCTSPLG